MHDVIIAERVCVQSESPQTGDYWTSRDVIFNKLKLTNSKTSSDPSTVSRGLVGRGLLLHVRHSDVCIVYTRTQYTSGLFSNSWAGLLDWRLYIVRPSVCPSLLNTNNVHIVNQCQLSFSFELYLVWLWYYLSDWLSSRQQLWLVRPSVVCHHYNCYLGI